MNRRTLRWSLVAALLSSLVLTGAASAKPAWIANAPQSKTTRGELDRASSAYNKARVRFDNASGLVQRQIARYKSTGNEQQKQWAQANGLQAAQAKVDMLKAQARGLKAKAKLAAKQGKADQANGYLDKADQLMAKATKMSAAIAKVEAKRAGAPTAAAPAPAADRAGRLHVDDLDLLGQEPAANPAAAPVHTPAAPAAAPAQAGDTENPFKSRGAFGYMKRDASEHRNGDRLRDVKALAKAHDWDGSMQVLQKMEEKATQGNFVQRAYRGVAAARARKAIRDEAGRVYRQGMEVTANDLHMPRMDVRMRHAERVDMASQLVASGQMSVAQARAELFAALKQDARQLPKQNQSVVVQAQRVLTQLARVEKERSSSGPVRWFASKLGSLVLGSAAGNLKGSVKELQARAAKLAKTGPEGAMAAHLLNRHLKTVARNASDLGLNPKAIERKSSATLSRALTTVENSLKAARKGDPAGVDLAYRTMEALRLDNPNNNLDKRLSGVLKNYERDMRESSLAALEQLSVYSSKLAGMKQPEALAEAGRVNGTALAIKERLVAGGVEVSAKVIKRLEKTDDIVNGRTKLSYKWRMANGAIAKTGVVVGAVARGVGKVAMLPIKIATLPVRLPYLIVKRLVKGNGMIEPAELDRKMRGLAGYAQTFAPQGPAGQQQMAPQGGEEEQPMAAAVPQGRGGMAVPPPIVPNAMPGH